jgi:signal transduction histidine kinase
MAQMGSLKARLVLVASIWIAIGVAVSGLLLSTVTREFLVNQFYEELYVHLEELQGLMQLDSAGQFSLQEPLSDPRYNTPLSGYYWEVQRGGKTLARSASLRGNVLPVPDDDGPDVQVHIHEIAGPTGQLFVAERLRFLAPGDEALRIIIATDRRILDTQVARFNKILTWSLGLFALSMIGAAGLLLLYALAPFGQLREALSRVRAGAEQRLSGTFPEEVRQLTDELNNLLAASGDQILRARAQAGNIAHGLKTPLAILVDEGHLLAARGETHSATVIHDQCRRMQTQIDYQIARARAAVDRAKPGTASSLSNTADQVVRALGRLYIDRGLAIDNLIPPELIVACEAQDVSEMLGNLVDNACRHASSRVLLHVKEDAPDGFVAIVIEDDGPGLPPESWAIVFKIGQGWGASTDGSGLGLPIVRDLVQLYGGTIKLGDSELGGLMVRVELPRFINSRSRLPQRELS